MISFILKKGFLRSRKLDGQNAVQPGLQHGDLPLVLIADLRDTFLQAGQLEEKLLRGDRQVDHAAVGQEMRARMHGQHGLQERTAKDRCGLCPVGRLHVIGAQEGIVQRGEERLAAGFGLRVAIPALAHG